MKTRKKIILILAFLVSLILPLISYSAEVTIVFTGNSFSSLYPCGVCPATVGGGVTRRATAIKELRKEDKNLLLIDSGNFTAGGIFDKESVNPSMDKKRSIFHYRAMQKMGYDLIALGESEFNFGIGFIKNNIKKFKFNIIGSNLSLKGVVPYQIKRINGVRLGFVALSPKIIHKRSGLDVGDYQESLKKAIKKIKSKCDLIMLVSALGDKEVVTLLDKFPEIKIAFSLGLGRGALPYETDKKAIVLRPFYDAKKLGILKLKVKKKEILDWKFEDKSLPLSLDEDREVKEIIPSCFRDENCSSKEGLIVKCKKPGEISSLCAYEEAAAVNVTVVTDENCAFCSILPTKKALKANFVGANFEVLDYKTKKAKKILSKYSVKTLPFFLIDSKVKKEENFFKLAPLFEDKGDKLLVKKELSGIFLFLKRKEISKKIDLFLNLYTKNAKEILNDLAAFSNKKNIKLTVYLVGLERKDVSYSQEELEIALIVKKLYPKEWFDYLSLRSEKIGVVPWIDSLDELDLDYSRIRKIRGSDKVKELVSVNNRQIDVLGIKNIK